MNTSVFYGTTLSNSTYIRSRYQPRIFFRDEAGHNHIAIDDPSFYKSTLLLGGAGSGKSNTMFQIVHQVRNWNRLDPNDRDEGVSVIFDTKTDYLTHKGFLRPGDYVLANDRDHRHLSAVWNIFEEVLADGTNPVDYAANAREIASVLFKGRGSQTQPFFANAARDIFAHMLIYFIRRSEEAPKDWLQHLNNYDFISFLLSRTPKEFNKIFHYYPDMTGLSSYIGDGSSNQSLGVFGELRSMIYDCFQGVFVEKPSVGRPSFSIRRAIREKKDRAIFILYDVSIGETLTPIYRLLVDLALKEALSGVQNGRVTLFLDELKLLPKVSHLEDALNFGRGKKVAVFAGLQNIHQLFESYGEETGKVILGGFGNLIAFHTGDHETREYVSQIFGNNFYGYRYYSENHTPVDREREGRTVEHWDLKSLKPGEAIVGLASQDYPFKFHFEMDQTNH